jgi:hydrogenase maturation protease
MSRTLIIAYGNPLRGDDGVGWRIAGRLTEILGDEFTNVLAVHQLAPELAEQIGEAKLVIFVDAAYGGEPGSWKCASVAPDSIPSNALAHYFTPAGLLGYAEAIYEAKPEARLLSIAAAAFDCGEQLTPRVEAVLPEIVQYICALVSRPPNVPGLKAVTWSADPRELFSR